MSRKWNHGILWAAPLAAFLVLAALPAQLGAEELIGGDTEIAAMAIHSDSVSFSPRGSFEEMTLAVGGQGHFSKQGFHNGETASFSPVDQEGYQLPDGTYTWELTVSPSLRDLDPKAFRSGKTSADGRTMEAAAAPPARVQSGVFTIKNGSLVDPNLIEVRASKARAASSLAEPPSAAERNAEQTDQDGN